jgi:hypothetical protein
MIPQDKIAHLLGGFTIATVFQFAGGWVVLIAFFAGLIKELVDKYIRKTFFDWKDFVCTGIGGFAGYWIMIVYR